MIITRITDECSWIENAICQPSKRMFTKRQDWENSYAPVCCFGKLKKGPITLHIAPISYILYIYIVRVQGP